MKNNISPETLQFLHDLKLNNDRNWFAENKARYDAARQNFLLFLDDLLPDLAAIEPAAHEQKGKDLVFRIYRDTRFSTDKRPYKDHFGAYLAEGGRKSIKPGYYLHLSAGGSFLAGGLWMPPAPELKAARQELDYNLEEFQEILNAPAFRKYFKEVSGDKLKTTPKGYSADNPAIELLRHKSWNVVHEVPDEVVTSEQFRDLVLNVFAAAKPFNEFFKRAIGDIGADE